VGLIALIGAGAAACVRLYNRWKRCCPERLETVVTSFRQSARVVIAFAGLVEGVLNALSLVGGMTRPAPGPVALGTRRIGEAPAELMA
jgi:hypothetical protein